MLIIKHSLSKHYYPKPLCFCTLNLTTMILFLFYDWGTGSTERSNNLLEMTELVAEQGFESTWAGTTVLDKQGTSLSSGNDNCFFFCSFHLLLWPFIASNIFCLHLFIRKVPWLFKVNQFYDVIIPVSTISLPSVLNSCETSLFPLSWLLLLSSIISSLLAPSSQQTCLALKKKSIFLNLLLSWITTLKKTHKT